MRRTAYELAGAADALGLVTGAARRFLFVSLALQPLLAALAFAAAVARRRRLVGAFACIVGIVGLASVAVAVGSTSTSEPGPPIAAAAALLAVLGGAPLLLRRSSRVRDH